MSDILAAAARRARYTGLPLDRVIKSEETRRRRQIERGQIPAAIVHQTIDPTPEAPLGTVEREALSANLGDGTAIVGGEAVTSKLDSEKPKRKTPAKKAAADPVETPETKKTEPSSADTGTATQVSSSTVSTATAEEVIALNKKRGNIGKAVSYIDPFKKERLGTISHVIPSNTLPSDMGISAKGTKVRDHISYVVETDKGGFVWVPSTKDDIGMKVVKPTA